MTQAEHDMIRELIRREFDQIRVNNRNYCRWIDVVVALARIKLQLRATLAISEALATANPEPPADHGSVIGKNL